MVTIIKPAKSTPALSQGYFKTDDSQEVSHHFREDLLKRYHIMHLTGVADLLRGTEEFAALSARLKQNTAEESVKVPDAALPCLIEALWVECSTPLLIVATDPDVSARIFDQIAEWFGTEEFINHFPEMPGLPLEYSYPEPAVTHRRMRSITALHSTSPNIVVTSVQAAAQATIDRAAFQKSTHYISTGITMPPSELARILTNGGYTQESHVEAPGEFTRRGGLIDVFPVNFDKPLRMEFFDDEIDSIRIFDPADQRSLSSIEQVIVPPAKENLPQLVDVERVKSLLEKSNLDSVEETRGRRIYEDVRRMQNGEDVDGSAFYAGFFQSGSIMEHLPQEGMVILLRPGEIEDTARALDFRLANIRSRKIESGLVPHGFPSPHIGWQKMLSLFVSHPRRLAITPWGIDLDLQKSIRSMPFTLLPFRRNSLDESVKDIAKYAKEGMRVAITSPHTPRIAEIMSETEGSVNLHTYIVDAPPKGEVALVKARLREGFLLEAGEGDRLALLTNAELIGIIKERPRPHRRSRRAPPLEALKPGILVVHIEHGIARFRGVETMSEEGKEGREYILLEYAEKDRLYVPVEHLDRIQLYRGTGGAEPRLTRLGSQEWRRAKARAHRAAESLAGELLSIYAAREVSQGISTGTDTPWQDQLEDAFLYEETPDQERTIGEVKADLESAQPMDRLICGDVGYGKTEVALRAAFKVAQTGRQIAILTPTTILAQQHFYTFKERLAPFPVEVELLSRFRSPREQSFILERTAQGKIDILIGTHRILQRDVAFHNLGLLIIDEEHKFGVVHKERIKKTRAQLDVLTLSATPIPRTLNMALAGIRDMSSIDTPPDDRLPVKTYVGEESDELIREAILREIDRNGQVYVLHNRVKDIDRFAAKIQRLVPDASVGLGHGQMQETDLSIVMDDFVNRKYDVLVCTTIIEAGLDIPNANTLVVDRADMFGLAQLYQLRGRVGRGNKRGYAYLLIPKGRRLTEQAEQRLNTILRASDLGAGFQIAQRDLEIRGVGNLLGAEQSGHIAAIGFDLYTRVLSDTVKEIKEGKKEVNTLFSDVEIDLALDACIPSAYVEDLPLRLELYRRLARMREVSDVDNIREEMQDRFGNIPRNVWYLLTQTCLRILAEEAGIVALRAGETEASLIFSHPIGGAARAMEAVMGNDVRVGHMRIKMKIDRKHNDWPEKLVDLLRKILAFKKKTLAALAIS